MFMDSIDISNFFNRSRRKALSKPFIDASIRLAEFSVFLVTVLSPLSASIIKQNDMTSFQPRHELEQSSSRLVERIVRRFISNLRTRWQLEYCMVEMSVFTLSNMVFTHLSQRKRYSYKITNLLAKYYNYSAIIPNCIREMFL